MRSWYIEAGGIHPLDLSNRLLTNLPQTAENNPQCEERQHSYQFKHERHHHRSILLVGRQRVGQQLPNRYGTHSPPTPSWKCREEEF